MLNYEKKDGVRQYIAPAFSSEKLPQVPFSCFLMEHLRRETKLQISQLPPVKLCKFPAIPAKSAPAGCFHLQATDIFKDRIVYTSWYKNSLSLPWVPSCVSPLPAMTGCCAAVSAKVYVRSTKGSVALTGLW